MASARSLIAAVGVLWALGAPTAGCRRLRRRGPVADLPRSTESDPRAGAASQCWDPRYVSGSRIVGLSPPGTTTVATLLPWPEGPAVVRADGGRVRVQTPGSPPSDLGPLSPAQTFVAAAGPAGLALALDSAEGAVLTLYDHGLAPRCTWTLPAGWHRPRMAARGRGFVLAARGAAGVGLAALDDRCTETGRAWVAASGVGDVDVTTAGPVTAVVWTTAAAAGGAVDLGVWRGGAVQTRRVHESLGAVGPVRVAYGDRRFAVAWSDRDTGSPALRVATLHPRRGPVSEPQRLSARFAPDADAALVWDGGAFAVAWSEPVSGGDPRGFAALVDASGRRVGTAMRVATEDPVGLTAPSLVRDPGGFALGFLRAGGGLDLRRVGSWLCDAPRPSVPSAAE